MKSEPEKSPLNVLSADDLDRINGGMWRGAGMAMRHFTRMGDGTVEGQQWYKDRQAAEAKARTDAAVAHARATIPDFDKIVSPSPFEPRQVGAGIKPPSFPGHPQMRKGK